MHTAHEQSWIVDAILALIMFSYIGIAAQFFWRSRRLRKSPARTALMQLVGIFVFCAFCGYLPRVISINSEVLLVAHLMLLTFSWSYMLLSRIDVLVVAVDEDEYDHRDEMWPRAK